METLWLVNGRQAGVDPGDRGLAYGDGLFETMMSERGTVRLLDWHFERLDNGCRRLGIPPPSRSVIEQEIASLVPRTGQAVVKLIVTRGPGARGYRPPTAPEPTRILGVSPWTGYAREHYRNGIRMAVCSSRLGENPLLAGMKHLCRLEQVVAQLELRDKDVEQGLLLDTSGRIVGGTASNLFAVRGGDLLTPAVTRCGIEGVMRRAVLAAAAEIGVRATQCDLSLEECLAADELFVTNALLGVCPVAEVDRKRWPVGAMTRRFMQHLGYDDA